MKPLSALHQRIDTSWPTASLRVYLVALIVLAMLPIAILMCYWLVSDVQGQRQRLQQELQQSANAVTQLVERELLASIDTLAILAATDPIQRHNIAAFEKSLRSPGLPLPPNWLGAYLLDKEGKLLFETTAAKPAGRRLRQTAAPPPFPAPLPTDALNLPARISDLVVDHWPGQSAIAIEVPVMVDGKPRYRLGAWIAVARWQELLQKAGAPAGAIAGLYDREHRLISRSQAPEALADEKMPETLVSSIGSAASGILRTPRGEQDAAYDAWKTVAQAGWVVDVGVPAGPYDARHQRAIGIALALGAACLMLGVLLALLIARRLTRSLDQLSADPQDDGKPRILIREVARLRDALIAAKAAEESVLARLKAKRDLLQRKADEFETLFESSPIGLAFAQDPECREVLHNAAMNALIGPPTAPTARLPGGQLPLQQAAADGKSVQGLELELQSEGREPVFVLVSAVPLCDSDGRPRGALSAMVDISERKRAEGHLASAEKRLRESQRLIELAQEAGHVGFFHYRFETDVLAWSPGLSRLFGMAAEARESTLEQFLARVASEHRLRVDHALSHAYASGLEKEALEFRIVLPDGTGRWLSCRIMINYGDDGRPSQMIGVSLDISDQKEAERGRAALTQREHAARIEAEAANRAKDEFLAMLGHELRNPLSAITAAIEVLNHVDASADAARSARSIIVRQTAHLARLMDDLLDVARVISGKILLTRQPINLVPLVNRLVATAQLTGIADRHQLNLALKEVWIDADATRIEQVVNNLLTNALKYTPAGGRIDVRVGRDGEQAVLEIRDTGVGIHPALLPKVFELFVQAERTLDRRAGGLGIGLTLVRRLVELHGGTVGAVSSTAGTVFTVCLPAVEAPPAAPEHERLPPSRRRRIGIIEDNEDALDTLHKMLELDGHSVWCANDGTSGLASLLENRPDVAVVDIGLPGLTGLEVAKRSRAAGYAGRMIALSGYGHDNFGEQALAAGFDAYLVKPVNADQLRRILADD